MSDSYSKMESDLKFEALEQRIDNKLDKMMHEIREGFHKIDQRFQLLEADIDRRFDRVDAKFDQVDAKFEQVNARFREVDAKFEQVYIHINWVKTMLIALFVPVAVALILSSLPSLFPWMAHH